MGKIFSSKYDKATEILWLITLVSSFFGILIFPVTIGNLGTFYLFRIALLTTSALFFAKAIFNKFSFVRDKSKLIKSVYILFVCMICYSIYSVFIALNFSFTLSRVMNLFFDILFCFLAIYFIPQNFKLNIKIITVSLITLQLLGVYETIFGGIVNNLYDGMSRYSFFRILLLQQPVVSFGNTNDFNSATAMITIIITWILIYYSDRLTKVEQNKSNIIIITINSLMFYLASCGLSTLTKYAMLIQLSLILIYAIVINREFLMIAITILLLFAFTHLMPTAQKYLIGIENNINLIISMFDENHEYEVKETPKVYGEEVTLSQQFDEDATGGVRLTLIKYGVDTIISSNFLGAGLGNTEIMAADAGVIEAWADREAISLHCFPIRILADMGVFILFPALVVFMLVLQNAYNAITKSERKKQAKYTLIIGTIAVFTTYICLSTASSDAQDLLPMWLFFALVVQLSDKGILSNIYK